MIVGTKSKCSRCKHRLPRRICGCASSPRFNQQIELTDVCDSFLPNAAQDHYSKALALGIFTDDEEASPEAITSVIDDLSSAIRLGLPDDDEMAARFALGESYLDIVSRAGDTEDPLESAEFAQGLQQMESALITDSRERYGYFSQPINKARLQRLAAAYAKVGQRTLARTGIDAAIAYVEQKTRLFDYLPSPPSFLMLYLGELYERKGDEQRAHEFFATIMRATESPVDEVDVKVRESARSRLAGPGAAHAKRSGCFLATAVMGSENAQEVEILRRFRDRYLLVTPRRAALVSAYCRLSPMLASLVSRSEVSKKLVAWLVVRPAARLARKRI